MRRFLKRLRTGVALIGATAGVLTTTPSQASVGRIEAALQTLGARRPGKAVYATFREDEKYVQCRRLDDGALRCEAAGVLLDPSPFSAGQLVQLTSLVSLGWDLDDNIGAFFQVFPSDEPTAAISARIADTLAGPYTADMANLLVDMAWVDEVSDLPRYANAATAQGLIALYGGRIAAQMRTLSRNANRTTLIVVQADVGYVQCMRATSPSGIYCEAQSAYSWPVLAAQVTADRVDWLRRIGYADPGEAPNHAKLYPEENWDEARIAAELLTILHAAYDYTGIVPLKIVSG